VPCSFHDGDAWWDMKQRGYQRPTRGFKAILLPRNTAAGVVLAALSTVFGIAMVWYMWWLAVASFVLIVGYAIYHTFNYDREFHLPLTEVIRSEDERTQLLATRS
jgi:cytochrome o ubiquinol oxidase subunit I